MSSTSHSCTSGSAGCAEEWCVVRQDDNGNEFAVSEHLSYAAARAMAADLESRGHKQLYLIRPMGHEG